MMNKACVVFVAFICGFLSPTPGAAQPPGNVDALRSELFVWFDTLRVPDVSGKPYVRVERVVSFEPRGGRPGRQSHSVEGFLLDEDESSFTVFISGIREFRAPDAPTLEPTFGESNIRYAPMRTVRFERQREWEREVGKETTTAAYERLELERRAAELAERVRQQALVEDDFNDLFWPLGYPAPGTQIVAFAHALRESGLALQGDELLALFLRACLAVDGCAWQNPLPLLQDNLARTYVEWAETDMTDGIVPRAELIDVYTSFESLFPPGEAVINLHRSYMRESGAVLEQMAADEGAHIDRPLESLSPSEQAAELIYELRNLHLSWPYQIGAPTAYPFEPFDPQDDSEKTAVHRLVDLGDAAVPALIDALADESFTRTWRVSLHAHPRRAMRVSEFAVAILDHIAGQRFPRESDGDRIVTALSRPHVEEWWAARQRNAIRIDDEALN